MRLLSEKKKEKRTTETKRVTRWLFYFDYYLMTMILGVISGTLYVVATNNNVAILVCLLVF